MPPRRDCWCCSQDQLPERADYTPFISFQIVTSLAEPLPLDQLRQWITRAHDEIEHAFEACIGNQARILLETNDLAETLYCSTLTRPTHYFSTASKRISCVERTKRREQSVCRFDTILDLLELGCFLLPGCTGIRQKRTVVALRLGVAEPKLVEWRCRRVGSELRLYKVGVCFRTRAPNMTLDGEDMQAYAGLSEFSYTLDDEY